MQSLTLNDLINRTMTGEERFYLASDVDAVLKRQAAAAVAGMNAATAISSGQLQQAHRLRGESSPESLESERQANAILTERIADLENELRIAKNAESDLRAFVHLLRPHIEAAAKAYGLTS
jgi:hypothetical protein